MSLHCTSPYPLNSIRPTLTPSVAFHGHCSRYRYGKMKCLTQNLGTRKSYLLSAPVHLQEDVLILYYGKFNFVLW